MASNYDPRSDTPTITRRRHVLACARCRARRVKCDRAEPVCSNCTKAGASCQPAQQPASPHASLQIRHREPIDRSRLSRLEEEVARLSREVDSASPSREPSLTPSPVEVEEVRILESKGRVLKGQGSRYLSPLSWAVVADQVADVERVLSPETTDPGMNQSRDSAILFTEQIESPMPDDRLHDVLLAVYSARVNPFVRVLHWPSFVKRVAAFRNKRSQKHLPPGGQYTDAYYSTQSFGTSISASDAAFLALLYSVYSVAIISVIEGPNAHELQGFSTIELSTTFEREVMKRVLRLDENATQLDCLEFLQAMVLLLSLPSTNFSLRSQWFKLGTAIRMAQGLGLHRDGSGFGFTPIETEIRRRLWAQLCVLDVRLAEKLCREPTITTESYDVLLPLSISDNDLAEIEMQHATSRSGQEAAYKTLLDIEQDHRRHSPFSSVSFSIIEAETARLQQKLHGARYRAQDWIYQSSLRSPQLTRRAASISTPRDDRYHWISRLEQQFHAVYRLHTHDPSNIMQFLISELASLALEKARFIAHLIEWREVYSLLDEPPNDEFVVIFREAIGLATRSLAIINQYHNTPYACYTKRLREPWSSSFLAFTLTSGQEISQQDQNAAWSILDQLYPVDSAGRIIERSISDSLLGKVLFKSRVKRAQQLRASSTRSLRDQAIRVATGSVYTTTIAPQISVSAVAGPSVFQPSGNLFEDLDALMDPIWPGGDSNYGNWV